MRDPEFLNRCDGALELLLRAHQQTPYVLQAADADRAPLAAASYDSDVVSGGGGGDPTLRHVIAPPRSAEAKRNLVDAWRTVIAAAEVIAFEVETLAKMDAHHAANLERARKADLRRRAERAATIARTINAELQTRQRGQDAENDACCRSCARTYAAPGVRRAADVHRRSDCGGVLEEPTPLCRWCYDYVRDFGQLPTKDEVEDHYSGKKKFRKAG